MLVWSSVNLDDSFYRSYEGSSVCHVNTWGMELCFFLAQKNNSAHSVSILSKVLKTLKCSHRAPLSENINIFFHSNLNYRVALSFPFRPLTYSALILKLQTWNTFLYSATLTATDVKKYWAVIRPLLLCLISRNIQTCAAWRKKYLHGSVVSAVVLTCQGLRFWVQSHHFSEKKVQ